MAYVESPMPVIFCCSPDDRDFNYFESLTEQGLRNLAIVDIDGNYTNNVQMAELPGEINSLKMLNSLRNKRIFKYDYSYKELNMRRELDSEQFVEDVRRVFLSLLTPFLNVVPSCID